MELVRNFRVVISEKRVIVVRQTSFRTPSGSLIPAFGNDADGWSPDLPQVVTGFPPERNVLLLPFSWIEVLNADGQWEKRLQGFDFEIDEGFEASKMNMLLDEICLDDNT
jgi:hypothetical protein